MSEMRLRCWPEEMDRPFVPFKVGTRITLGTSTIYEVVSDPKEQPDGSYVVDLEDVTSGRSA